MFINVLSFKNGKTIVFKSETPYSVNKLNETTGADKYGDWNLVTDSSTGEVMSFRGTEVVTISTVPIKEELKDKQSVDKSKKKTKIAFKSRIVQ
ncbi:MAG: hypothetical protein E6005_07690 [Peptostreptococcus sp.]|uniref:hypothetical protein n=1 Tax=Bacillota TaxID=1239 RepID=UPI0029106F99|nr:MULTISPECIES: hypothetical protein [Bacillota]MDU3434306.1 hypothetical protein [Veillonella sp.]MDU3454555.1 hypothetical protein [Peptostreptococcus sp.]MDU5681746.1 hypothetical protein [Peptostreptococcus sp.]MDU5738741.1 hypothetical protein [Peptostreptococcus sp.]